MAYDKIKWQKRIESRTDLTAHVYHLTKDELDSNGNIALEAFDRLIKIIREKKLIGSSTELGFITGKRKTVCFQDAPISGIVQNILHENTYRDELGGKTRYSYFGLAFPKLYIFENEGRPVLYEEKEIAKKILPSDEHWRIVDFNLKDENKLIDWTHEREWRIPIDEFHFDLSKAIILLPNGTMHKKLIEELTDEELQSINGIIQLTPLVY